MALQRFEEQRKHPHERGEDEGKISQIVLPAETPPRAWGRLQAFRLWDGRRRNTPTSVGKTWPACGASRWSKKHPHERGEDVSHTTGYVNNVETPPRAWGRRCLHARGLPGTGNTPTSVGKTATPRRRPRAGRKHPHERGEDGTEGTVRTGREETPPRAWGRPYVRWLLYFSSGNTPTSVGKTLVHSLKRYKPEKHPHERGEDAAFKAGHGVQQETPPRAWGRRTKAQRGQTGKGNTPTSVGKTAVVENRPGTFPKHPHERGEDHRPTMFPRSHQETPPRAWGRPERRGAGCGPMRNTPTSVGKTAAGCWW